jgi:hypothetical protein
VTSAYGQRRRPGGAEAGNASALEAFSAAHIVSGAAEQLARWWPANPDVTIEFVVEGLITVVWPELQKRLSEAAA